MKTSLMKWSVGQKLTSTALRVLALASAFGMTAWSSAAERRSVSGETNQVKAAASAPPTVTVVVSPGGSDLKVAAPEAAGSPEQEQLLEEEIKLLEAELVHTRKLVETGHASQSSLLTLQRELLALRRKQLGAAQGAGNLAQEKALLNEEVKLVEKELASAQQRVAVGTTPKGTTLPFHRELLRLKRELAALEAQEKTAAVVDATASKFHRTLAPAQRFSGATAELDSKLATGVMEEEANLDLNAAIQSYRSLINQFDGQRPLAASAIFRLGECYRRLGKMNEARGQYARILAEFPYQTPLVQLCRKQLSGMALSGVSSPGAGMLPAAILDPETNLEQQLAVAKRDAAEYERQRKKSEGEKAMITGTVKEDWPRFPDEAVSDAQFNRLKSVYEDAVLNSMHPDYRGVSPADARKQMEQWITEIHLLRLDGKVDYAARRYTEATNEVARLEAKLKQAQQPGPGQPDNVQLPLTRVYALRQAQAATVASALQPFLPAECKLVVVADSRANALLASGPADRMAALEQLIQQLDTGTRVAPATGTDAPSDLEWQLAQARKEEINARRELLNLEALLATKVNTLKANRSSEQARQELLQAENDLEAAKAQLNLQSSEVKRLEDKLSEIQLQASEGRLSTAAAARERELMYDKLKYLKHLAVGVNLYADKNAGRLPNNLKEALAIHGTDAPPGFVLEAFELVCRGRMQEIQDATQTIIIREKAAVKTRDRKWMKCYAFADGHTEVHVESTGQFEAWEKPRLKQP